MSKLIAALYIFFICVFSFMPKSAQTFGFLFVLFMSIYTLWLNRNAIAFHYSWNEETRKLKKFFNLFILVASCYLVLSFFDIPRLWNIHGLYFDKSFIPRHFFIVAELFIPVLLGYSLYRLKLWDKIHVGVLIVFYIAVFITVHQLCSIGLLLVLLALITWKLERKWMMVFALFINTIQSTYILAFLVMMFIISYEKAIISYLSRNTVIKIVFCMSLAILGIFLLSDFLMVYIEEDINSLWRLRVWVNEIESLKKTWFSGVGFGTAYVTEDIMLQVDNNNMYSNAAKGGVDTGFFVVANHSSLLNMFYRMGIIGGFLFLVLNVQIVRVVLDVYRQAENKMSRLLWRMFAVFMYETIVICLNPGLEMMQFALSYIMSLAVLLAVILEIEDQSRFLLEIEDVR